MRPNVHRARARKVEGGPRPRPFRADSDLLASLIERIESLEADRDELSGQLSALRAELDGHRRVSAYHLRVACEEFSRGMAESCAAVNAQVAEVSGKMLDAIHATRAISTHLLMRPGPN